MDRTAAWPSLAAAVDYTHNWLLHIRAQLPDGSSSLSKTLLLHGAAVAVCGMSLLLLIASIAVGAPKELIMALKLLLFCSIKENITIWLQACRLSCQRMRTCVPPQVGSHFGTRC